jgi:pilus assembly protein Flp/PilA
LAIPNGVYSVTTDIAAVCIADGPLSLFEARINMIQTLRALLAKSPLPNQDGVTLIEYGLLIALIALVCILAITFIGQAASNTLSTAATSI